MKITSTVAGFTLCVSLVLCLSANAALRPGQMSEVRRRSEQPDIRIQGLVDLLRDEIEEPTISREGLGGGTITHKYQLAQLAKAIWHEAKRPGGRPVLEQALAAETNAEASDVLAVALGNCGERSVADRLIQIATSDDSEHIRAFAVHGLLQSRVYEAIPDLILLLSDANWHYKLDLSTSSDKPWFPVRNQAWIVLKQFGVSSARHYATRLYSADPKSAIDVLQKQLVSGEGDSKPLLTAISRIGGADAKAALQGYIDANAEAVERAPLVVHARAALESTPSTTIEERRDKMPLPDEILNPPRPEGALAVPIPAPHVVSSEEERVETPSSPIP